jgi:hypothetical protein
VSKPKYDDGIYYGAVDKGGEFMAEIKRRNGYYLVRERQLPSVSTILKSAGSSEGLVQWGAKQGGLGVIWGLARINNIEELKERLGSPSCVEWASGAALANLSNEGDRVKGFGSNVHAGIEAHLKQITFEAELTEEEKTAIATFENFYAEIGFDPLSIETEVYNLEYGYAGRLDLAAEITEEQAQKLQTYLTKSSEPVQPGLIICDFKTGSMYPRSQVVQLAAYAFAYSKTYHRPCDGGLIINIKRDEPDKIKCHYFTRRELIDAYLDCFLPALKVWRFLDAPRWYRKAEEEREEELSKKAY